MVLGLLCVGLAALGAFLPMLPTTPFLLLALWFFTRCSPRMRHWLLTNRLFGRYLDDYRSGRGIPLKAKAAVLTLLWGTMLYAIIWIAGTWWLRALLLGIATAVTVHVVRLRTRKKQHTMQRRIVVISPTCEEIAPFMRSGFSVPGIEMEVVVGGVGMAETAATTASVLTAWQPSLVILAGIAGRYPSSPLEVGDVALVTRERVADLGSMHRTGFRPYAQTDYQCTLAESFADFVHATSFTVSTAALPEVNTGADLENMEGAAFFALCLRCGVEFLELRAVSNTVSDSRLDWDIPLATANLASELERLISAYR